MSTTEHLALFQKYFQDEDALARSATPAELALFRHKEWQIINLFLHLLHNQRAGNAGPEIDAQIGQLRTEHVADDAAWATLKALR